jgi:hypothetical protein
VPALSSLTSNAHTLFPEPHPFRATCIAGSRPRHATFSSKQAIHSCSEKPGVQIFHTRRGYSTRVHPGMHCGRTKAARRASGKNWYRECVSQPVMTTSPVAKQEDQRQSLLVSINLGCSYFVHNADPCFEKCVGTRTSLGY